MEPLYKPHGVEERWQSAWEEEGLYRAGAGRRRDESFVIAVPPPNVTGELHMGHALNGAIQDALIRYHRLRGFDTLWQPGYDHAGIATQNVVEKQLLAEGTSRQEIGREAFLERTWGWLELTGRTIMGQYRRLGASLADVRHLCALHMKRSMHDALVAELGGPAVTYLDDTGHMSGVDSLLGLDRAARAGELADGDLVLLLSAGTGYTWAACCVRWGAA